MRLAFATIMILSVSGVAFARDTGRWSATPKHIRDWYQSLMQPDRPAVSCCGDADATEADVWTSNADGSVEAIVTNGRGVVPKGTVVHVPAAKIKQDAGNPTGHAILFLSPSGTPYCFIMGTLI